MTTFYMIARQMCYVAVCHHVWQVPILGAYIWQRHATTFSDNPWGGSYFDLIVSMLNHGPQRRATVSDMMSSLTSGESLIWFREVLGKETLIARQAI